MMNKSINTRSPRIDVKGLSYDVPGKDILDHISLSIKNQEFVGLIGPNGSGKTTILKHMYRALPPEKKTIYINGCEINHMTHRETSRELTVMRQENATDFDYSIVEMVLMGRAPYRKMYERDTKEDVKMAMDSLAVVGLQDIASQSFFSLSGGEKQRVLIARSLAQEADILLLDEPTNHLDVHYQWSIMELIKNLNKTVLSVFHEMNLACRFCDRLFVIDKGRVVAEGSPYQVCTKELLRDVFRIEADIITNSDGTPYIAYKRALTYPAAL